jgi:hypothetical protein
MNQIQSPVLGGVLGWVDEYWRKHSSPPSEEELVEKIWEVMNLLNFQGLYSPEMFVEIFPIIKDIAVKYSRGERSILLMGVFSPPPSAFWRN